MPILPDMYPCKPDIFAATYEAAAPATSLKFGQALEAIQAGQRIARTGWNGKGMFVYFVPPASYPVQTGAAKAHFGKGAMVPYNAYMAIKNVDGTVSTWVPSVNDCLATDWSIAGEGAKVAERFSAPMMADGSAADPEKFGVVAIDALPVIDPGPDSLERCIQNHSNERAAKTGMDLAAHDAVTSLALRGLKDVARPDPLERAHAGNHASAVLYPAIERAMGELETLHPGFNDAANRAFNHLHDAFWSQCPAPASAATKRPVQAA